MTKICKCFTVYLHYFFGLDYSDFEFQFLAKKYRKIGTYLYWRDLARRRVIEKGAVKKTLQKDSNDIKEEEKCVDATHNALDVSVQKKDDVIDEKKYIETTEVSDVVYLENYSRWRKLQPRRLFFDINGVTFRN